MRLGLDNLTGIWQLKGPGTYHDVVMNIPVTYTVGGNQSCQVDIILDMWSPRIDDAHVSTTVSVFDTDHNSVEFRYRVNWEHYKVHSFSIPLLVYCTVLFGALLWTVRMMLRFSVDIEPCRPTGLTTLSNIVGMGTHAWVALFLWLIDMKFTDDFDRRQADNFWTVYACTAAIAGYTCAWVKCYHATCTRVTLVSCEDMLSLWFLPGAFFLLWQHQDLDWKERAFSMGLWVGIGIPSYLIAHRIGHLLYRRTSDRLYTLARPPHRSLLLLSVLPCVIVSYQWPYVVSLWFDGGSALLEEIIGAWLVLVLSAMVCAWINVYVGYRSGRYNWPWRSITSSSSIMLYVWFLLYLSYERNGWRAMIPPADYLVTITAACLLGSVMLGSLGWITSRAFVQRWHQNNKVE